MPEDIEYIDSLQRLTIPQHARLLQQVWLGRKGRQSEQSCRNQ